MTGDSDVRGTRGTTSNLYKLCAADILFSKRYDMSTWKVLGKGSFATVVKLHCHLRAQDVAVKIFREVDDEESRRRIPDEVTNSGGSPRHVRVYSPHENAEGDLLWLEMELVGPSLQQEIARRVKDGRGFSIDEALAIAIDAAQALKDAHAAGVLHRDVTPANFLLAAGSPFLVKLGDFGISKMRELKITATGAFHGTPEYSAPEVAHGIVTRASDVYSLGHTLFKLFTGEHALLIPANATAAQMIHLHENGRRRLAKELRPDMPDGLNELFARMLNPKPDHRPSVAEVVESLQTQQEELRGAAAPTTEPIAASPSLPKWKLTVLAAVAVAVLMIAIIGPSASHRGDSANVTQTVPATDAPATAGIPSVPRQFGVRSTSSGAWLDNLTSTTVESVDVTLVADRGQRYVSRQTNVEPGELWLSPDDFIPPVPKAFTGRAEIAVPGQPVLSVTIQSD